MSWVFNYTEMDRPPKNRRTLADSDLDDMDNDIQFALTQTLKTKRAVRMLLWQFHSSPAKGRLWAMGYRVLHRVLPNRREVAAWIERENREGRKNRGKSNDKGKG